MKKQITKGLTMFGLVVTIALATSVASAKAQSKGPARANIPFEFVVGDKTLQAGEYQVGTMGGDAMVIRISNTENGQTAIRLSNSATASKVPEKGKLVFRRYANHYFLAEIYSAGDSAGRRLLKSKQESAVEHELATIRSKNHSVQTGFELVEVASFNR